MKACKLHALKSLENFKLGAYNELTVRDHEVKRWIITQSTSREIPRKLGMKYF